MKRRVLVTLAMLVACEGAESEIEDVSRGDDAVVAVEEELTQASCERCHVEEAREWRGSAHRTAFADEVFQAEWAPRRQAACVRCHAPLADAERPEGPSAADGVSCVACHVRDGVVRAAQSAPRAPHPIVVDPSLSTVDACASCHDFTFALVEPTPYAPGILQGTVHEWHEVEARGTCQSCHMRESGRTTHAIHGARDVALLTRALRIDVSAREVTGGSELTFVLTSEAGHAVPTGDMYRRLEIRAWPIDASGRPTADATSTVLARRFASIDGELREVEDDRVPASGSRTLVLPQRRARRFGWSVDWQALDPALAETRWLPAEDVVRRVAEGVVELRR